MSRDQLVAADGPGPLAQEGPAEADDGWRTVTRGKASTSTHASGAPNGEAKRLGTLSETNDRLLDPALRHGRGHASSHGGPMPTQPDDPSPVQTSLVSEDSGIGLGSADQEISGLPQESPSQTQMGISSYLDRVRRSTNSYASSNGKALPVVSQDSALLAAEAHGIDAVAATPEKSLQNGPRQNQVRRLSAAKIEELTSSPESLSLHPAPLEDHERSTTPQTGYEGHHATFEPLEHLPAEGSVFAASKVDKEVETPANDRSLDKKNLLYPRRTDERVNEGFPNGLKLRSSSRAVSTPSGLGVKIFTRGVDSNDQSARSFKTKRNVPSPLQLDSTTPAASAKAAEQRPPSPSPVASPMPASIPLPPMSLPTYLQLELSSSRPSPLYIHRPVLSDFPYESSKVKFERLLNFLLLPPQLELTLWFGALACLDSWLYSFTILPLRFFIALGILSRWWASTLVNETKEISRFVFLGLGRLWKRGLRGGQHVASTEPPIQSGRRSRSRRKSASEKAAANVKNLAAADDSDRPFPTLSGREQRRIKSGAHRHRRTYSIPSALLADHKADLLKGLVVLFSCLVLMRFDASRMYHGIRGQAAIKLYVIYNVLEVCDRLFSALGQDVFECLFSKETLERNPDGRSKLLRPFGMFWLALSYNVIHSTALFYQVITLNVAVNSYSNALLTLLMSNQFVEIKSTVFKKFEKENLFQLTCADVVERFQLWLMLLIIALRNIAEVGGLSLGSRGSSFWGNHVTGGNTTSGDGFRGGGVIPKSFTIFPKWNGQVLGPFLLVLGSEMLVDWLKHAYITKFNNTKPAIYGRFLDVLAKDYYSNAFSDQNLTRRLGLPVIPLSCLFIRASLQTYHMFLATNMPLPIPSSATSLSVESAPTTSPATTAALQHFDTIIRRALGRSSFGAGGDPTMTSSSYSSWITRWTADDAIAFMTMLIFFLGVFLVLLAFKLVLGMLLLAFARNRYRSMKQRENEDVSAGGRRIGGWGVVEVDEDKRRWIYQDDPNGARALREREKTALMREQEKRGPDQYDGISRYTMVAKRIW